MERAVRSRERRGARRPHRARPVGDRRPHDGPRGVGRRVQRHHRQERRRLARSASAMSATPRTAWPSGAASPTTRTSPAVILDVRRQTGTNTVNVVEEIQRRLADVNRSCPPACADRRDQGTGHLHQELGRGARRAPGARQPAGLASSSACSSATGARCSSARSPSPPRSSPRSP